MTDGTTKLNRKSVLDDSSSIMSGVNVFNPFETRRASIVRHGGGRIITEVYELRNGDRRRPTGTEGGVLDDGTKSRMNKQCLKTYSEFFCVGALKWRTLWDAEAGHAAWTCMLQTAKIPLVSQIETYQWRYRKHSGQKEQQLRGSSIKGGAVFWKRKKNHSIFYLFIYLLPVTHHMKCLIILTQPWFSPPN